MNDIKTKRERLMIAAVIVISVAGILYSGFRVIRDNSRRAGVNPFEYNIDEFKKSDPGLVSYSEAGRIPIRLETLFGIAVGPDDEIYVSANRSVLVFNSDGTSRASLSSAQQVRCLAVERNGDLYFGKIDHIEVYDRGGSLKASWEPMGDEAIFTSIALTENWVFVADAGHKIVWKFDKTGKRWGRIGQKDENRDIPGFIIPSPFFDVAVDPDGFLWAANTGRHSLENYTQNGDFRTSWGEFSMEVEGFCGCCNPSHFAFLEDGSFVTSEKGIARVKIYNRLGNLEAVVAGPDQFDEGTVGLDLAVDSNQRILVLDPSQKLVRIYIKQNKLSGTLE